MATRGSNKSAAESEDNKTETLNTKSMERLLMSFSKAIQNAMTAGVVAASAAATAAIRAQYSRATTMKYTSAINLFGNQSFSVSPNKESISWAK